MAQSARRSIKERVSVKGTGLHTGATTEAVFLPAPAGQGVVFRRMDLKGHPEIPARLTEVEAVERRTAIGKGEATIHTVEHLLAARSATAASRRTSPRSPRRSPSRSAASRPCSPSKRRSR